MDEQHDQAVLDIKNETDTDNDYLSILREMQQSLNTDGELTTVPQTVSDEFGVIPDQVFDAASPQSLPESLSANNKFAALVEESDTGDYFANAKTQPLPEPPTDFNDDLNNNAKGETNFDDVSVALAENSSASETTTSEAFEPLNFTGSTDEVGSNNHSFSYFAEMSPILFDSNEQVDVAEPDFEADLSSGAVNEAVLEPTIETPSANTPNNLSEAITDEMPTNLAFGEMFAQDSTIPASAANLASIDIDEEAEFNLLLEHLESESFPLTGSLSESVPPLSEQNLEKHILAESSSNNSSGKSVETSNNDALEFGLPEPMLLGEKANSFAPEPSFALLNDTEPESADETVTELLEETRAEDLKEADLTDLAIPSFLQAELIAAKQSAAEESSPKGLSAPETSTDAAQDAATELKLPENEMFAAPPSSTEREHYETFEADSTSLKTTTDNFGLNDLTVAAEAQEMPETALFENLTAGTDEIDYPDDFSEGYSAASLKNIPEHSQAETPDSLPADNFKTEMSEIDFVEFDLPSAPAAPNFNEPQAREQPSKAVLENSKQNSVARSLLQEMSDLPKSVSFLKERFVIFKLDDTLYGFPAVNVAEIGQILPITPLPFVPSWFLGISNLRGDILSVVGLRELWEKNTGSPHKAKILVVRSEKQALTVGLVVDAVREMRHVTPEEIFSDDSPAESHFAPYQIGVAEYEGQNLCLLNAEKLLESLRS